MSYAEHNKQLLKKVLSWSSLEAFLFQSLLIIHNLLLFNRIPLTEYGRMGIIFSIAYSLAYCMTTGFDAFYVQEEQGIKPTTIKHHLLLIQCIWMGGILGLLLVIRHVLLPFPWLALVLGAIEAIKRSLKIINISHHHFVRVTGYELLHLSMYCSTIWILYSVGYKLDTSLLIIPLIITTLCCAISYAGHLTMQFYWPCNFYALLYHRALLCIGTLYHILFSGNVMTPLAYVTLGPVYAGGIKLASTCTHGIISIIERVLTTGATLIRNPKEDATILYTLMGNYVWLATGIGSFLSSVLVGYTLWKQNCTFLLPYAALYIILHIAGIISVLCERVLLTESPHKAPYLTIVSIVSVSISILLGLYTTHPLWGIILFVLTRILLSIGLGIQASRRIAPHYFTILSHNLFILFCALFLCVFFMRQ